MIVDSPINYRLAVGQDRVIPQPGDTQLEIPATILPVTLAMQETQFGSILDALTVRRVFSTFIGTEQIRPPSSVALVTDMMTLGKGLWELQMELSNQADFAGTAAVPSRVQIAIQYQGTNLSLINSYHPNGTVNLYASVRMLFTENALVRLIQPATAVAQNLVSRAMVNAIKVL